MIVAGDVAIGGGSAFCYQEFPKHLIEAAWSFNLEGSIRRSQAVNAVGVFNPDDWPRALGHRRLGPVFIGNNHINDLSNGTEEAIQWLSDRRIAFFGAGRDRSEACNLARLKGDNP